MPHNAFPSALTCFGTGWTMITIRTATDRDIPALVEFEIEIAKVSFQDRAVTEPAVHRQRLVRGLERDPDTTFVAVNDHDYAVGWLWMTVNTNFLTNEKYGNLRSLAVRPGLDAGVADALLSHAIRRAQEMELPELTGKVHACNLPMRIVYRLHEFVPSFLAMRRELDAKS
jgi:N-acetylglutamate synthase-like GNAT family acetyltransferase